MSYVTNPIANRLGIQQGWSNSLISLRSGLNNISFMTYLKCYLLMQEYLRYNQMNLIFFEIKPLQKNKKLIHLFIYKNIFHLEKNELLFDARKELAKNGFLQLALYLHRKQIKDYKFKSKNNPNISYSNLYKKIKLGNQFAAFRSITQLDSNVKKFKKNRLTIYAKRFTTRLRRVTKRYCFSKSIKSRPNRQKKYIYYKKNHLLWKATKSHFLKSKKLKRKYNKKNKKKWWLNKYNRKKKQNLPRLKVSYIKITREKKKLRRLAAYPGKKKKKKLDKKGSLSVLKFNHQKIGTAKKKLRLRPQKSVLYRSKFFIKLLFFNKVWLKKNKIGRKINLNKNIESKFESIKQRKFKKKKILRTQKKNFTGFLQIAKWVRWKILLNNPRLLQKLRRKRKEFRNMLYVLWKHALIRPLMLRLPYTILNFSFDSKKWPWKNFEKHKEVNPLRYVSFIKSNVSRKKKRPQKLKLHNLHFQRYFNKSKKLRLAWKHQILYNFKEQKPKFHLSTNPLAFIRYISFINTYQKLQKFPILNSIKFMSWKAKKGIKIKKAKFRFYLYNLESQPKKLSIQFQFFVEKYIQRYLRFPIVAKLQNINDFVDPRSNQKSVDYTRQVFLKPLVGKSFFVRLLYTLLNTERVFNPQLFIDLIAAEMQKTNNYRKLVNNMIFMFSILHSEHIMGYKVLIDGKLGGSKQKSTKQIFKLQNKEKIPIQTFTKNISYALGVARTPAGLFGIRMWLYY